MTFTLSIVQERVSHTEAVYVPRRFRVVDFREKGFILTWAVAFIVSLLFFFKFFYINVYKQLTVITSLATRYMQSKR